MTAHHTRTVALTCNPPPAEVLPTDAGRRGGRRRWWVAAGYGSARWSRRTGYLTVDVPPALREAVDVARFTVPLAPGSRYCIGVGEARYEVTLPPGDWSALYLHPVDRTRAVVQLVRTDGAIEHTIDTDPHDDTDTDSIPF